MTEAMPSQNSVIFSNLLRLFRLTGDVDYHSTATKIPAAFSRTLRSAPSAHAFFLCALDYALGNPSEVVISGDLARVDATGYDSCGFYRILSSVSLVFRQEGYRPEKTIMPGLYTDSYPAIGGRATAYVCTGSTCSVPVTDPEALKKSLSKAG